MRKLFVIVLAVVLALSVAACGGGQQSATAPAAPAPQTPAAGADGAPADRGNAGLSGAIAEQPVLLTSGGQSADYQMIGTILRNLNIEHTSENVATSADLNGFKTVVVAVGGSSKGLGAAGIDAEGEIARLEELLGAAKASGVTIIVMHTGGESRRGDLSDRFIEPVFSYGDYAVVVASGDADGLMAGICAANDIPVDIVNGIGDVATVLPNAFK